MLTVTTELINATRMTNTVNGNPRYRLHTTDGDYITSSDSACAYEVQNLLHSRRGQDVITVTLSLTRAGRVWGIDS